MPSGDLLPGSPGPRWRQGTGAEPERPGERAPPSPAAVLALPRAAFEAVLFDLDGVLTRTEALHRSAWTQTFNAFLEAHARRAGAPFRPFGEEDYRHDVDGRPRYDGVERFLESRGIRLPRGTPADAPGAPTCCGLGNRKDLLFRRLLQERGAEVIAPSVAFVRHLREAGLRTAVISASKNTGDVLRSAQLEGLFDVQVDGREQERLGLRGKPAPDTFLEAARRLGVAPARAAVVEDAVAGVEAGRAGGFGLVIGLAPANRRSELVAHGADVVVPHLGRVRLVRSEEERG